MPPPFPDGNTEERRFDTEGTHMKTIIAILILGLVGFSGEGGVS